MMSSMMKKILAILCAAGAAIVCLAMIGFEMINHDIPAVTWLMFSMLMFANAALLRMNKEQAF